MSSVRQTEIMRQLVNPQAAPDNALDQIAAAVARILQSPEAQARAMKHDEVGGRVINGCDVTDSR